MQSVSRKLNEAIEMITVSEGILQDYLIENTDKVFEEIPEIDSARVLLNESLKILGGNPKGKNHAR